MTSHQQVLYLIDYNLNWGRVLTKNLKVRDLIQQDLFKKHFLFSVELLDCVKKADEATHEPEMIWIIETRM